MEPSIGESASVSWNVWITTESIILSLLGSYTSLLILDQGRINSTRGVNVLVFLIASGIIMGTVSCWSSNFVNQNSFSIYHQTLDNILEIEYDFVFSVVSLLIACVCCTASLFFSRGFGPHGIIRNVKTDGEQHVKNGRPSHCRFESVFENASSVDRKEDLVHVLMASLIFSLGMTGMIVIGRRSIGIPNYRVTIQIWNVMGALVLSFVTCALSIMTQYALPPRNYGLVALILGIGVTFSETIALHGTRFTYYPERSWPPIIRVSLFNTTLFVTIATISVCFLFLLGSSKMIQDKRKKLTEALDELQLEQARSNSLLLSIMPQHIAKRITEGERNIHESHDNVTVVLIDITNFTLISEGFSRPVIIETLHLLFSEMDAIARRYDVTKIKTIGDCWMGCCGVINQHPDHAGRTVRFAMGVIHAIKYYNTSVYRESETPYIQVRVGINSGPVISGVIGSDTFHFDIWGPCANLAAKMESLCPEPNAIQISESTYHELRTDQGPEQSSTKDHSPPRRDGEDLSASTAQFDSLDTSHLYELFTRKGVVETKRGRTLNTYFCAVLTRQERIVDNNLATLQKNRIRAILHARRSFSYVASGVLEEENDMLRTRVVHFENIK